MLTGIEFDDDGSPIGVADAVKQLLEDKPFLKKTAGTSGAGASAGNGASDRGRSKLTRESLSAMSTAEVAQLDQAEVDRVLAAD